MGANLQGLNGGDENLGRGGAQEALDGRYRSMIPLRACPRLEGGRDGGGEWMGEAIVWRDIYDTWLFLVTEWCSSNRFKAAHVSVLVVCIGLKRRRSKSGGGGGVVVVSVKWRLMIACEGWLGPNPLRTFGDKLT